MPDRDEDVRLSLRGREYAHWQNIEITRALDSYSTVSFSAPFEPDRGTFREDFRPFAFHDLAVSVGGEALLMGTQVEVDPSTVPESGTVGVNGYAKPGVLDDVNMPPSAWPLEYNGLTLTQVAERVCEPFGFGVRVDGDVGSAFARVSMDPDAKPHGFLSDLARQRGMVLSDSPDGRLWLRRSAGPAERSVAALVEGKAPVVGVSVAFNAREYYSEITGAGAARAGRRGASSTALNTHVSYTRPRVYKPDDAEAGDVPSASRAQLGRMFGNAAGYEVSMPTWRTPGGALWAPNMVVSLDAPGAMVYQTTQLIVRTVTLRKSSESQSCTLGLVLPGSFSGEVPEVLPWA